MTMIQMDLVFLDVFFLKNDGTGRALTQNEEMTGRMDCAGNNRECKRIFMSLTDRSDVLIHCVVVEIC